MAKIECIKVFSQKADLNKIVTPLVISINAKLKFLPVEVNFKMHYQLHFFILDACTDMETTVLLVNWDEAVICQNKSDLNNVLDHLNIGIEAVEGEVNIKKVATIVNRDKEVVCGIKVLAKLVPVISEATKLSNNYLFDLQLM